MSRAQGIAIPVGFARIALGRLDDLQRRPHIGLEIGQLRHIQVFSRLISAETWDDISGDLHELIGDSGVLQRIELAVGGEIQAMLIGLDAQHKWDVEAVAVLVLPQNLAHRAAVPAQQHVDGLEPGFPKGDADPAALILGKPAGRALAALARVRLDRDAGRQLAIQCLRIDALRPPAAFEVRIVAVAGDHELALQEVLGAVADGAAAILVLLRATDLEDVSPLMGVAFAGGAIDDGEQQLHAEEMRIARVLLLPAIGLAPEWHIGQDRK